VYYMTYLRTTAAAAVGKSLIISLTSNDIYQVTRVTRLITVAICVRRLRNECDVVVFWSMNNSARAKFVFGNRHYIIMHICITITIPTVDPCSSWSDEKFIRRRADKYLRLCVHASFCWTQ